MDAPSLVTTIGGGLAIVGAIFHFTRKAVRFLGEWIETMRSLRDLTEQFVRSLVEDEQRFKRLEDHAGLPPWKVRKGP